MSFNFTWDNTGQKSHHVGEKHVGGDGQKEAHEDKDHGQERHPQGQDTEPTGAADPTVSCNKKNPIHYYRPPGGGHLFNIKVISSYVFLRTYYF